MKVEELNARFVEVRAMALRATAVVEVIGG